MTLRAPDFAGRLRSWAVALRLLALVLVSGVAHGKTGPDGRLVQAAMAGDIPGMTQALGDGADVNVSEALLFAVESAQHGAVDFLLSHGADPNYWLRWEDSVPFGAVGSPIYQAAKLGDKTLVADLVRHGGNIDGQDSRQGVEGSTALIMAALKDELVAVRTLVECGANVNRQTSRGETALYLAIVQHGRNSDAIIATLLANGADPDLKTVAGDSPRSQAFSVKTPKLRIAMQRAKPLPPFSRPEDERNIAMVLAYKAACDLAIADYAKRTRTDYAHWRQPRAAVIAKIEADPQYQEGLARLREQAQAKRSGAPGDSQAPLDAAGTQSEEARARQAVCEDQLIREFRHVAGEGGLGENSMP